MRLLYEPRDNNKREQYLCSKSFNGIPQATFCERNCPLPAGTGNKTVDDVVPLKCDTTLLTYRRAQP